jgi:hypothetical protein
MRLPTYTVHDLIRDLRGGKYTSVGFYPTFFLCADGETLSHEAVRENLWLVARATRDYAKGERYFDGEQWAIVGFDINWEDREMICAHTGKPIECAYPSD